MRVSDLDIDRIYVDQIARPQDYGVSANHFHCYYELFYVRQGKCRFFVDNRLVDVNVGEILIIPPREVHYNRYLSSTVRTVVYFREQDVCENGVLSIPDFEKHFKQMHMIHVPSTHRPYIESLLDSMLKEESINDESISYMLELLLKQFFLSLNRYCTFRGSSLDSFDGGTEDVLTATHFISENYQHPITLEEIAAKVSLSPTYLSKKFHQVTGKTIKEHLNAERLKHASLELISTHHTITEIALNSGFSDANYFKDVFKKTFGSSPREYRKRRAEVYRKDKSIQNNSDNLHEINSEAIEALSSTSRQ